MYLSYLNHKNKAVVLCLGKTVMVLGLWLGLISPSWALFTFSSFLSARTLTLQVGSPNSTIDRVTIDVSGSSIAPTATSVNGTSNGPTTTPAGGVEIRAYMGYTNNTNTSVTNAFRLTVNSSVGLSCVTGSGCGTTTIPFSAIGWTSYNHDPTYSTVDIQDNKFTGATAQSLTNIVASGGSLTMTNILVFKYNTTTIYPAGQYTGRVTYTATLP